MRADIVLVVSHGIPFIARRVDFGERYGRNWSLVHDEPRRPLIEFYDARYPHCELGQFVSRYHLETLLERPLGDLNLNGGVTDWWIDAMALDAALGKLAP